jgi:hypothetical protein
MDHQFGRFGTRADQRHVADQHIEQLRQFIEFGSAQKRASAGDARIPCKRQVRAAASWRRRHRTELVDLERSSCAANTSLPVENRPAVLAPDRDCDEREKRHEKGEPDRRSQHVDDALGRTAPGRGCAYSQRFGVRCHARQPSASRRTAMTSCASTSRIPG